MAWGAALTLVGTVSITVAAGASSVAPHALSPGSDIYMSVSGVTGDGSSVGGAGTIEVSSFSWGASNASSTAGAGTSAGKVKVSSITITKSVDRASPSFFKSACVGAHYPTVTLAVRKAGVAGTAPSDSMQIVLSNVFVSSYSMSGGGGDEVPTESITLNFTKIQMIYAPQGAASISFGWNLRSKAAF